MGFNKGFKGLSGSSKGLLYGLCPHTTSRWAPVKRSSYSLFIVTNLPEASATKRNLPAP